MIARLVEKNNTLICSECHMKQPRARPKCIFCNAIFSNYEIFILKDLNEVNQYDG